MQLYLRTTHQPSMMSCRWSVGVIEVARRHAGVHRPFEERGDRVDLGLGEVEVRHLQPILLGLLLALVVDRRILQLVLEEALVRVPAFRLGLVAEQREIQALDRLRAFLGQLGADALLFFETGDLVAAGAAVVAHQGQPLFFRFGSSR